MALEQATTRSKAALNTGTSFASIEMLPSQTATDMGSVDTSSLFPCKQNRSNDEMGLPECLFTLSGTCCLP